MKSNAANIDADAYLADLKLKKRAEREGKPKPTLVNIAPPQEAPRTGKVLALKQGGDVQIERIEWLWDGFLARGKPHIIAGAPGNGKTTIAIALIACITSGLPFPDGTLPVRGNVIIWSGEDDPGDTLAPRLLAAGAKMDRVYFVDRVDEDGVNRPFDPARDLDALLDAARALAEGTANDGGVVLIMVDPIISAVNADSHKNAETRRALQPLVDLAAELNAALLGITHFSKGTQGRDPLDRVSGSLAFGAVPRVVMVVARQQQTTGGAVPQRILCRAKSNIGPDGGGFTYDIGMAHVPGQPDDFLASLIVWTGRLEGSAREILQEAEEIIPDETSAMEDAEDFLKVELAAKPVESKDMKKRASDAGHAWATVRRAAERLGVKHEKAKTENGGWLWLLPEPKVPSAEVEDDHKKP
jgi:putative DNA primase/helicase